MKKVTLREPRTPLERRRALRVIQGEGHGVPGVARPKTRADCKGGPRPCPWASCEYHLYVDVYDRGVTLRFPHTDDFEKLPYTCALDVADEGRHTLKEVAEIYGVTREAIRQVEAKALRKLYATAPTVYREFTSD